MPGHELLRNGALACVFRLRDRRKPRPGLRIEWEGALSQEDLRMTSGEAGLRPNRSCRAGIVRALARAAVGTAIPEDAASASVIVPGFNPTITGSARESEPEQERLWRGGRLRAEERDLCFRFGPHSAATRGMVSGVVSAVGAFFMVRALADGHVEAIPFGPANEMFQEESTVGTDSVMICFLRQTMGPGYLDPRSDTLLADLAALRPYEAALAAGKQATDFLADLLFGPVNAQIGNVLEREAGPRSLRLEPSPDLAAAVAVAAEITGKTIIIHWQPPASPHGFPRIDGAAALEGFLASDEEAILQALFMAAAHEMRPELDLPSEMMEPDHPWAPRVRPSYRFSTRERSSHSVVADVATMARIWRERRACPAEGWRFHRFDGRPIPAGILARIDAWFGVA